MSSIHRQLRDWCRRRNYEACDDFATQMDDLLTELLAGEDEITPEMLLSACRQSRGTRFFAENDLDPEAVAQNLASYLELPPIRTRMKKVTPDQPDEPQDLDNPSDPPPDLFVSYYHEDKDFVKRLAQAVAERGYTVWYDERGLSGGESIPREIERAVGSARKIGIVCTPQSLERPWVKKEMDAGHTREGQGEGDILVPIRLEPCELPPLLAPKNWCDFANNFDRGLQDVVGALT